MIPGHISIEKRSALANRKKRLCNIEEDLFIGKNYKRDLLVTLDRASLVTTIDKINAKKPQHIKKLIFKRMKNNGHQNIDIW